MQTLYRELRMVEMKTTIQASDINRTFIDQQLPGSFGITFSEIKGEGEFFVPIAAHLTVDHRHLRPGNIMNGGVSLVLIETIGSIAASCFVDLKTQNPLGLQVSANHLTIAHPGDQLTATASAVHVGKTTHIWEVIIVNQKEKVVSSGRITCLIANKPPQVR